MEGLLNLSSMPLYGLLNETAARLGNPALIDVDLICNKDTYVSELVSQHFFMVFITNFMYASACPLF